MTFELVSWIAKPASSKSLPSGSFRAKCWDGRDSPNKHWLFSRGNFADEYILIIRMASKGKMKALPLTNRTLYQNLRDRERWDS